MGQTALGAELLRLGYWGRAGRRLQVDPRPRGRRCGQNRYQPRRGHQAHLPRLLDRRHPEGEGRVRGGRVPPPERRAPEQAAAPRFQGRAHEAPGPLAAPPRPAEGDERERFTDGRAPHNRERRELRGSARRGQLPRGRVPEVHPAGREDADDPRRVHPPAEGPAADPAGPGARARRELRPDDLGRSAGPARGRGAEHVLHPPGRARPERVDVRRAHGHLDERRHARRDHRGARRAEGPAPQRRDRRDDEDAR